MFKNLLSIQQCNILIRSALTGTRRERFQDAFCPSPAQEFRIEHAFDRCFGVCGQDSGGGGRNEIYTSTSL